MTLGRKPEHGRDKHTRHLTEELAAAREEYTAGGLEESDLTDDPYALFERWYADARDAGVHEPNALVVSTVDPDGRPSSRMVLLKGVQVPGEDGVAEADGGFRFFTNTASRKGRAIAAEPRVALLFPWHTLERQVRIEGTARPLERAEVDAYFAVRPRGSRLGAHASHQSRVVDGRAELEAAYEAAEQRFEGVEEVPTPPEWGGYLVVPEVVEFWQGRPGRMHDRLVYERADGGGWTTARLAP